MAQLDGCRNRSRLLAWRLEIAFHDLHIEMRDHAVFILDELDARTSKDEFRFGNGRELLLRASADRHHQLGRRPS